MIRTLSFIFGCLVFFILFVFFYVRYYEKNGVYFPSKEIFTTPKDLGLDYQDVFLATADRTRLHGWFIPHPQGRYTFLFLHGNGGNISHRVDIVEILHRLGVNVFIIDWRGYGKSQGKPCERGLYEDAFTAYRYLVDERKILPDSIIVYGRSLGGNVGIDLASKVKVKALISDSGFSSAKDMARIIFPLVPAHWFLSVKFDALSKIRYIDCPKLIIHSKSDEMIPIRLGRKLFEEAKEPKQFLEISGSHNEAIFAHNSIYVTSLKGFLEDL